MTNTTSTEFKTSPEIGIPHGHDPNLPTGQKPKKRGIIWIVLFLIVAGVAGYAVWRAGQPAPVAQNGRGGGGGGRGPGGGRGGPAGPVPVVVTAVSRNAVPVYLNGLGNVTAFYTVTVKAL